LSSVTLHGTRSCYSIADARRLVLCRPLSGKDTRSAGRVRGKRLLEEKSATSHRYATKRRSIVCKDVVVILHRRLFVSRATMARKSGQNGEMMRRSLWKGDEGSLSGRGML
jgi:hypothetical protein